MKVEFKETEELAGSDLSVKSFGVVTRSGSGWGIGQLVWRESDDRIINFAAKGWNGPHASYRVRQLVEGEQFTVTV